MNRLSTVFVSNTPAIIYNLGMNNPYKLLAALVLLVFSATVLSLSIVAVSEPSSQTAAVNAGQQLQNTPHNISVSISLVDYTKDQHDIFTCPKCLNFHAITSINNHAEYHYQNWLDQLVADLTKNNSSQERIDKSEWNYFDGTTIRNSSHSILPGGYPAGARNADGTPAAENIYTCSGDPIQNDPLCVNRSDTIPNGLPNTNQAYGHLEFETAAASQTSDLQLPPDMPYADTQTVNDAISPKGVSPKTVIPITRDYSLTKQSTTELGAIGDPGTYDVTLGVSLTQFNYENVLNKNPILHKKVVPCNTISFLGKTGNLIPGLYDCAITVRVSLPQNDTIIDVTPEIPSTSMDPHAYYYVYDVWYKSAKYVPPTQASSNKFNNNDTVSVIDDVNVRNSPALGTSYTTIQTAGVRGRVIGGPVVANGYTWWKIAWSNGLLGWSAQNFLTKILPTQSPAPANQLPSPSPKP